MKGVAERPEKERVQSVSVESGSRIGEGSSRERRGSESAEGERECTCWVLAAAWVGDGRGVDGVVDDRGPAEVGLGADGAEGGVGGDGCDCWERRGKEESWRVVWFAWMWKRRSKFRLLDGVEVREATSLAPARLDVAALMLLCWCIESLMSMSKS